MFAGEGVAEGRAGTSGQPEFAVDESHRNDEMQSGSNQEEVWRAHTVIQKKG
jgi:hypothetical protein